jgi:serine/threonine protein kinase
MASVYKAYHAALDRYVALKVLHPAFLEDPNFLARFQREARLVAKLDHPNIVPIFDYSEYEGRPYLVMKYIEGETLKARLTRGPISSYEISRIMGAVGAALSYAHKHGILHRDIKPSNVLLANDGGIYLADFGLARIAATGESTLSTDMVMGTPQYVSPEQALGKKDLDEGTDIYSLGVMLYELVVGKVPFNADTPFSIIHDHIYTPLPMPSKVNPQVSAEVERVLLKALAKERRDRYPDIDSFVTGGVTGLSCRCPHPGSPPGHNGSNCCSGGRHRGPAPTAATRFSSTRTSRPRQRDLKERISLDVVRGGSGPFSGMRGYVIRPGWIWAESRSRQPPAGFRNGRALCPDLPWGGHCEFPGCCCRATVHCLSRDGTRGYIHHRCSSTGCSASQ